MIPIRLRVSSVLLLLLAVVLAIRMQGNLHPTYSQADLDKAAAEIRAYKS